MLGLIIDSTNAYFDEQKQKYIKKVKLVDETYNTTRYNPFQKYPYLNVFFYSSKIEDLPNPKFIGDILYLRRYPSSHQDSPSDTTTRVSRATTSTTTTAHGLWSMETPAPPIPRSTRLQGRTSTFRTRSSRT